MAKILRKSKAQFQKLNALLAKIDITSLIHSKILRLNSNSSMQNEKKRV